MRRLGFAITRLLVLMCAFALAPNAFANQDVLDGFNSLNYDNSVAAGACTTCHTGLPGTFTAPLFNRAFSGTTPGTYATEIQSYVNSFHSPKFSTSSSSINLSKSSNAASNIASTTLTAGACAFANSCGTAPVVSSTSSNFSMSSSGSISLLANKPFANQFGTISVTFTAKSPEGLFQKGNSSGSHTLSITLQNTKPALTQATYATAKAGQAVTINLVASDIDNDTVIFSGLSAPAQGTAGAMSSGGSFQYTAPASANGSFTETMSVSINDGSGAVTANFTIKLDAGTNTPPVANDATFNVTEDTAFNGTLPATDTDALTFSPLGSTALTHGTIVVNADGTFTYTPKLNDTAGDTFTYTARDTFNVTDTGTLTFNVGAVSDKPEVVNPVPPLALNQVSNVAGTLSKDLNDYVTDSDTPASGLTYTFLGTDNNRSGAVTVSPQGIMQYTARVNWAGQFKIIFQVTDNPADTSRAVVGSVDVTVTLNGKGGHDQPNGATIAAVAGSLTNRYTPYFPPGSANPQSCHNCHQPGKVTEKAPDCNTSFFTAYGAALCEYKPFDPDFADRLAHIAPQFEPSFTANQAEPIEVLENAAVGSKVGSPLLLTPGKNLDGNVATIVSGTIESASPPDAASYFSLNASGQLTLKKSLIGSGKTVLVIYPQPVNDARQKNAAGALDATRKGGFYQPKGTGNTLTVFVRKVAPIVADDSYQTNVDPAPFVMNVIANDTAGGTIDSVFVVSQPANGTVTVQGKKLVYVSNGTPGGDSFTYKARRNGVGDSENAATVSLQVFDANTAVAQPDGPFNVTIGQTAKLDILSNDRGPAPDTVNLSATKPPQLGTAQFVGQTLEYTATTAGTDVFDYDVTRGGVTTTASITVIVGKVSGAALVAGVSNPALKSIAKALGDTCQTINQNGGGTAKQQQLTTICNDLVQKAGTKGAIDAALTELQNEEVLAAGDVVQQQDRASASNILGRLDAVRDGQGRGLNFSQMNLKIDGQALSGSLIDATIQQASYDEFAEKGDLPWGVFVAGTVSIASKKSNDQEAGFDLSGIMLTTGIDYQIDERSLMGLAVSIGHTESDVGDTSDLESTSAQLAAYGSVKLADGLYIDGYGGVTFNDFDLKRSIAFGSGASAVNQVARGSFDGEAFSAALRLKYETNLGSANLSTYATMSYVAAWTNGYVETGAGGLGLSVGDQDFDTLAATIGFRLSDSFAFENGSIRPYIGASVSRQLDSDKRSVASSFIAGGAGASEFVVTTRSDGENFGTIELGFAADLDNGMTFTTDLSGTFSDDSFEGYMIKAGFNIPLGVPKRSAPTEEPIPPVRKPKTPTIKRTPTKSDGDSSPGGDSPGSPGGGWGGG